MPAIDRDREHTTVRRLLREHVGDVDGGIVQLAGGYFSHTFACAVDGSEYVVRLNSDDHACESFNKDDYAWKRFASPILPIPRLVATGEIDGGWYAISERVAGRTLRENSPPEQWKVLPELLDIVEAIGQSNVSSSQGYGDWDGDGHGRFSSWHAFLASTAANHPDGYYANWHHLFDDSFLERDLFDLVTRRMLELADGCPNERSLIHNDLHFDNILSDGERITGIVDWANALYGDSLYDVAWLIWQADHPGWWYDDGVEILHRRFGAAPDYDVRIACYKCHIGLDHLRFYARTDNRDWYDFCRDWLLKLLQATSHL